MQFEWDEDKNISNLFKHSVDFHQAIEVFSDENKIVSVDDRSDYGEQRIKVVGKSMDLMLSVIYTVRDTNYRIISARSASRKERADYNNNI